MWDPPLLDSLLTSGEVTSRSIFGKGDATHRSAARATKVGLEKPRGEEEAERKTESERGTECEGGSVKKKNKERHGASGLISSWRVDENLRVRGLGNFRIERKSRETEGESGVKERRDLSPQEAREEKGTEPTRVREKRRGGIHEKRRGRTERKRLRGSSDKNQKQKEECYWTGEDGER